MKIQRAVGFEFEDQSWTVLQLQSDWDALRNPNSWDPAHWLAGGKNAPPGSEKSEQEQREEKYKGTNIFQGGGNHINNLVGKFDLQTGPKKGTLHQGLDYAIEPDGPYSDVGPTNRMDLEIVTEPFPETEAGERRLEAALSDLRRVFNRYNARAVGEWNGEEESLRYDKFVTPAQHGFSTPGIHLYGGKPGGFFKPQVTGGIRLADLPHVMETLGVAKTTERSDGETDKVKDGVRQMVYGSSDPAELGKASVIRAMGSAPGRARTVTGKLVSAGVLEADTVGVADLKGFLSLAILYMTALSATNKEGIKTQLPLMSRHSFVTLWAQIPGPTRSVCEESAGQAALFEALGPEVAASANEFLITKYGASVKDRATGLDDPMLYFAPSLPQDFREPLGRMTRRDWLWMIVNGGRDMLNAEDLIATVKESDLEPTGTKYDKSMAIFFRGHGNTKTVKNVAGEDASSLALLENRNITSGPATFDQIETLARHYLSWMRLIKEAGPLEK